MWVLYALLSAGLLGLYDVFKKQSLKDNAVIPVLFVNCLLCTFFFLPSIIGSACGLIGEESAAYIPPGTWYEHKLVMLKAVIVLSSWICGYFAIKHLPLTIVGPVNATRPVLTLVGALLIFGERLNLLQWCGVLIAVAAFFMLGHTGKKEGIDFKKNRWIWCLVAAAVTGAMSGLYDKYLIAGVGMNRLFTQGWYNLYQTVIMGGILLVLWYPSRSRSTSFRWLWSIPFISIFLTLADLAYLRALAVPGAMIAIVSMIRRGSVLVSFLFGALLFKEKNLRGKAIDLSLVLLSMLFLFFGS